MSHFLPIFVQSDDSDISRSSEYAYQPVLIVPDTQELVFQPVLISPHATGAPQAVEEA